MLKKVAAPLAPKIQIAPPANLGTDGRICFYGYDFEMPWLIEYATAHWCWCPIDSEFYDDFSKISGGLRLLKMHSGIKRLMFEAALKDDTVPSDVVTIPGNRPGEVRVPIISIFSDEGPSYRKRPSKEQVDRLSEIMGKQPRWWVDYEGPETYGD